ncbi:glycoside-pentoside-hexuronide (GPH):cation symporter [Catenovulum sediminis]|uniref:Glycoside-pentoside-hexuronide (GPH):cation symporter n=1 Tax=Catenovulum sediminis TaxID=1740262 RepID=A0ABV1RBV1_9ALTE|nr:glycoside-pentoside-hexuronide (GPH):cation symporter [Catenovulum sediminis]
MSQQRLSIKEKLGYGLGDTASNIVFQILANFMLIFYTDVFGISAAAAGTLMLVVRLFDGITDPIMGGIADRTRTRFGTYRPYLLIMCIPYGMLAVVAFTTPDIAQDSKLVYAYVSYALLMTCYTAINIPYSALGGVMTSDPRERASLQSFRFAMAMSGGVIVVWALPQLVDAFAEYGQQTGYQYAMAILALLAVVCFLTCFLLTEEREQVKVSKQSSIIKDFASLFKNDQWVLMVVITVFVLTLIGLRSAIAPHYVKYYVGDESLTSNFLTMGMIASVLGALATHFLSQKFGKKPLFQFGLIIGVIAHAALFVLPASQIVFIFFVFFVANFVHMIVTPLMFSMIADTVDYGHLKTGKKIMAMTFSGHLLAIKLGFAIGGATAGWLLSIYNYVPNQAQTKEALSGIMLGFAAVPAVLLAAAYFVMNKYKLTEGKLYKVQEKLSISE